MKRIKLTKGKYALVDDEDFEVLSKHKWHFDGMYARRHDYPTGERIRLHRAILEPKFNEEIDHINRNKLDNRRSNLRIVDASQNRMNRPLQSNNKSGFRGVSWLVSRKRWVARIKFYNKIKVLKYTKDKTEAARIYNEAALKYHGEFAQLNII